MGRAFIETMSLASEIFPTFWCMRAFLLASLIAYLNGRFGSYNIKILFVELIILWFVGWFWTFIFMFGCFVPILLNKEKFSAYFENSIVQIVALIVAFVFITREECISTYILDGVFAAILLIIMEKNKMMSNILGGLNIFCYLGRCTMSICLIHNLIYFTLGQWLFSFVFLDSSCWDDFILVLGACLLVILSISVVLHKILVFYNLFVSRFLVYII